MRAEAARAGITVHGYRPHRDVLAAMALAAIVVVPSRWPEPFGLAALEAMACGAALICAPAGNLPALTAGAAVLANAADLPAAIDALMTNASHRHALSCAGMARAAAFGAPKAAEALDQLRAALLP